MEYSAAELVSKYAGHAYAHVLWSEHKLLPTFLSTLREVLGPDDLLAHKGRTYPLLHTVARDVALEVSPLPLPDAAHPSCTHA